MFLGVGTDLLPVARIAALVTSRESPFVERWFTAAEVDYCFTKAHPAQHLAARLAAKEAVFKALRVSSDRSVPWREIEMGHDGTGAPVVRLTGSIAESSREAGIAEVLITVAHTEEHATATALAIGAQAG